MIRMFKIPAYIRWTLFSTISRRLLGRRNNGLLYGNGVATEFRTALQNPAIERHLVDVKTVDSAEIVEYGFPASFPRWFPSSDAFELKRIFLFRDARIEPRYGAVSLIANKDKQDIFLSPTVIGFDVYMQSGMYESMMPSAHNKVDGIYFAFATCFAYYHELVEVMLSALQAREWQPTLKILLHPKHPRFIDDMLSFFGFTEDDVALSERPINVDRVVVVPHWIQRSAISRSDAVYLRRCVYNRICVQSPKDGIYISRRKARSRSLTNEQQLEDALTRIGYKICYFEDMTIAEQFQAIADAKTIVALHGSGLANLVAAQVGTRVLEIISPEWRRSTFARLASELSLGYDFIMAEQDGDAYRVSIDDVLKLLNCGNHQ